MKRFRSGPRGLRRVKTAFESSTWAIGFALEGAPGAPPGLISASLARALVSEALLTRRKLPGGVGSLREASEASAVAAAEQRRASGKAIGVECDVTDEAHRMALVDAAAQAFGRISILVNNAGGGGPKPFDMPMSDFEWAYQLNVFASFRHMQKAGGRSAPPSPWRRSLGRRERPRGTRAASAGDRVRRAL